MDDAIETAAAEWLCEREEGFAPGRAQAFTAWRAADPRHAEAILRTEQAMALIAEMPEVLESLEAQIAGQSPSEPRVIRGAIFRPPAWTVGLAAALFLAVSLWWFLPGRAAEPQRFVTAGARQQQVALKDGSVVNLNISTEVLVQLTRNERRVTLATGEAHFAVAHDTSRPFIVTAAGVSVRAVGTAFSVRIGDVGVEVLVTEGKVEVTRETVVVPAMTHLPVERPTLVAGQRAMISRDAPMAAAAIDRVSPAALSEAERWHSAVMTFSDLPLREAINLFNRRNATQLILADAKLGDRKIGGTFAADQVEAFVRLLAQDGEVAFERRGAAEIVLRPAP